MIVTRTCSTSNTAFRFYEEHLGGEVTMMLKGRDLPPGASAPPGFEDSVVHARMRVAGVEWIGNDVPSDHYQPIRSAYLYLAVDTVEDAERIYAVLSDGGQIGSPLGEAFFATRFAQLRDRFGTLWTIIHPRA